MDSRGAKGDCAARIVVCVLSYARLSLQPTNGKAPRLVEAGLFVRSVAAEARYVSC